MTNVENSLKSSINKTTMLQQDRCSFIMKEMNGERETPPNDNENVSHLKRSTPILFSTNRGLHLRLATSATTDRPTTPTRLIPNNNLDLPIVNSTYSILFCDLERWSTNRANTISLEDTFTISKPAVSSSSVASNNLRFLPQRTTTTSVHFNGYSRFNIE